MAIKGGGVRPVAAMWALTGLTFIFLLFRLYTRLIILRVFSSDDHVFILAFIFLLAMTAFYTKAATLGFGQSNAEIGDEDKIVAATFWEAIGQTFTVLGTAIAKWSLGLFLLRLVTKRWQRVVIWTAMGSVMLASIIVVFLFWFQVSRPSPTISIVRFASFCTPVEYLWDRRIPGGDCPIDLIPASTVLNVATVLVDFLFAALPWFFIWGLQINQHEKIVILASMSLGVFAAAAGIVRALEIDGLSSPNFLRDTVGLILWSAIEQTVTMVCICIPVCRPLFKTVIRTVRSQKSTLTDRIYGNGSYRLSSLARGPLSHKKPGVEDGGELGLRARLPDTTNKDRTNISNCYAGGPQTSNGSDEEILIQPTGNANLEGRIYVTNEFHVTST
ncbi:hypothetical protein GQX73_g9800 [Xylaria multiplex]|uniref:Rhodopsin domain-containing protein n=1 Tax=Xylaria multiplex TaxID=323545 RepID=A0A7C8IQ95_9PEZI|nr:hypothetical protein GQX73_g9800 [Xylaria multiplex]